MQKKIIDKKADKNSLYINASVICANASLIPIKKLNDEIDTLNNKLKKSSPYYLAACKIIYGDKNVTKLDLSLPENQQKACELIYAFIENCSDIITKNFKNHLKEKQHNSQSEIEKALRAIIDLTENSKINLISKDELIKIISLDFNDPNTYETLKKDYFIPSIQNIMTHKGVTDPKKFIKDLEDLASSSKKIEVKSENGGPITISKLLVPLSENQNMFVGSSTVGSLTMCHVPATKSNKKEQMAAVSKMLEGFKNKRK